MNVNDLFARKPARRKPGGLTQAEADRIEAEFLAAMEPLGQKAVEFFRCFDLNGKRYFWLLPACEGVGQLSTERMAYVLKYRDWFVAQIAKQELDELPFL